MSSKDRLTTVQYPEERVPHIEASRNFPFLVYDGSDPASGSALRRLPDLRERVPAPVHLHREEQGQEAGLRRQAAVLSRGLRHRYLGLHELPDLRGGLPVRAIRMDNEFELQHRRPLRRTAVDQASSWQSPTSTTTRSSHRSGRRRRSARRRAGQGEARPRPPQAPSQLPRQRRSRAEAQPRAVNRNDPCARSVDQIFVIAQALAAGFVPAARSRSSRRSVHRSRPHRLPCSFRIHHRARAQRAWANAEPLRPESRRPCGFLQPIADAMKSLTKEDIVPRSADQIVHFLAPVVLVVASFLAYAVLPVGRNMVAGRT